MLDYNIVNINSIELKNFRKKNKMTQADLAKKLGVHLNTIVGYEKGAIIPESKQALLMSVLGMSEIESDANGSNGRISNEQFTDLEYIPIKARAGFAELQQMAPLTIETYRVIRTEIGESYTNQVVIEIDGDSMEPNYTSGTKVRCKEVAPGDWVYINSGVYVVVYSNFFVVKRVKNSPSNGILTLHSDNSATGGTTDVPLDDVRKIWKVMRIVDAPAR